MDRYLQLGADLSCLKDLGISLTDTYLSQNLHDKYNKWGKDGY